MTIVDFCQLDEPLLKQWISLLFLFLAVLKIIWPGLHRFSSFHTNIEHVVDLDKEVKFVARLFVGNSQSINFQKKQEYIKNLSTDLDSAPKLRI